MQINDLVDIKSKNVKSILDCIRRNSSMTKKDIATMTGLSFATVSNLCNELKSMGITEECKVTTSRIGRTPSGLCIRRNRYCFVVLDFRLENMLGFAIIGIQNNVLYQATMDTSMLHSPEAVIRYAKEKFDEVVEILNLKDTIFLRVGAAVPAIYDSVDGRLKTCTIPMFADYPLKSALAEVFGIQAYVDNITNFGALSIYSQVRSNSPIVCLDISQGVGVGLIVNGMLIRGKNGYGSEIAHVPIGRPEAVCTACGRTGCAEILLSVGGMTAQFQDIPNSIPLLLRWQRFVDIMQAGGEKPAAIAHEIGEQVGKLASILINLFDPSYFGISGYIVDIYNLIQPYVEKEINARCSLSMDRGLKLQLLSNAFSSIYRGVGDALYEAWNPFEDHIAASDE